MFSEISFDNNTMNIELVEIEDKTIISIYYDGKII
jgi:hypothetical protein